MSNEHQLVPVSSKGGELALDYGAQPQAEQDPMLVVRRVHNMMRGRYLLAIFAGLTLGAIGAAAGYFSQTPQYRSTGIIRIEPILPKLLYSTEQNQMMPMFDAYVGTQVVYLRDRRTVEKAMKHEAWRSLNRPFSLEATEEFMQSLNVNHTGRSGMIFVSFTDEDKLAAKRAVNAVIDSYMELHGETNATSFTNRLNLLEQRRNRLRDELASLEREKLAIAEKWGTHNVGTIYDTRFRELLKIESQLEEAKLVLNVSESPEDRDARKKAEEAGANPREEAIRRAPQMTDNEIKAVDPQMAGLLDRKKQIENAIDYNSHDYGPEHRIMKDMKRQLDDVDRRIAERRDEYIAEVLQTGQLVTAGDGETGLTIEQLRERVDSLQMRHDTLAEVVRDLGDSQLSMNKLDSEMMGQQRLLTETENRLEQLNVEAIGSGRLSILSQGDEPFRPAIDKRMRYAIMGAGAGGMLGAGIFVLIALLDRRLRSIYDAQDTFNEVQMLGILPRLPDDLSDPDQAAMAAHCVHQIRTLLQIGSDVQGRRVFCITSPASQDGKTSLTLALGLSFAASGAKTLMIDADLAGGGLSARVNALIRRKVGAILQRQHLVTEQQVEQALRVAMESDRRLGETLIDLGFVKEQDLNAALHLQEQMRVGILDVVQGEPLEACTAESGIPGLSILPIGGAEASDVAKLSPAAVRRLLDEARAQYDMVIVDTGPAPGALEASQVAAEADGVVMIVSRGEQRSQAQRSIEHLESIGARMAGLVFNRAEGWDIRAASQSMSVSMAGQFAAAERAERQGGQGGQSGRYTYHMRESGESSRFGPVARAVASAGSRKEDQDDEEAGSNGSGSHG